MRSGIGMVGNGKVRPGDRGNGDRVTGATLSPGVVERVCIISICEEV